LKNSDTLSRSVVTATVTLLGGLLVLFCATIHPTSAQTTNAPVRILILPFHIESTEDISYLSGGLEEMLSSRLASFETITLVDRSAVSSAIRKRGITHLDSQSGRQLGKEANADFVILGTFEKTPERVALNATIVDTTGDKPDMSASYQDGTMQDVMQGIKVLAERINHQLLGQEVVTEITIRGNRLIEDDAILYQLSLKPGDVFTPERIKESIREIYEMGFFSDIQVDSADEPGGKKITFIIQENPEISEIRITGNKEVNTGDIQEELDLLPHTILNNTKVSENVSKIRTFYQGKGYYSALVDYSTEPTGENQVAVVFSIVEHHPMKIETITFTGNEHIKAKKIKKIMETREKGLFSFVTDSGLFKEEALQQDLDRIRALYYDNGYMDIKVSEPEVDHDNESIYITIPIEEGKQYTVSFVKVTGDLIAPEEQLINLLTLKPQQIFSRTIIRDDINALSNYYGEQGYAFADVTPLTNINADDRTIGVTYDIAPGQKVYFEDITITGNTRTRDKVVRRELRFKENELYSTKKLQKSRERLDNLGYFEEVTVNTSEGSEKDKIDVNVNVKEKPTGMISAGAGYSSVDNVVGMFQVSQDNFLGKGLHAVAMAQIGSNNRYRLGITNPYLFDKEVSLGFSIFKVDLEYDDFDSKSTGFDTTLAFRPFGKEDWRLGFTYELSQTDISDIESWCEDEPCISPCDPDDPTCEDPCEDFNPCDCDNWKSDVDREIWEAEGSTTVSSFTTILSRNTIDNRFYPMRGSLNSLSFQLAGGPFLGPEKFYKFMLDSKWYFPFKWDTAFMVRGSTGFVDGYLGNGVPIFERFFLGGLDSLRGFDYRSVGPEGDASTITQYIENPDTGELCPITVHLTGDATTGGYSMLLFNFEYLFPLIKAAKIRGLVFFDTGNAYEDGDFIDPTDMRESVGWGIRWNSPFGPLRVEWGYVLDPKDDEDSNQIEFSVGTAF